MKLLRLSKKAYELYRTTVRDNEGISKDQSRKKLTRNVLLAKDITLIEERVKTIPTCTYAFGNLYIWVKLNKVVAIKNHKGKPIHPDWKFNHKRYIELNEILGIVD